MRRAPFIVWVALAVAALACGISGEPSEDAVQTTIAETAEAGEVSEEAEEAIEEEEAPTNTPAPTTISTPIPQPVTFDGVGNDVVEVTIPSPLNRAVMLHTGFSNFIVRAYGPNNEEVLVANDIGIVDSIVLLTGEPGDWLFEIEADGEWVVGIEPLVMDETLDLLTESRHDHISDLFIPSQTGRAILLYSHSGSSNFIAWLHCASGSELVANEIGTVSGSTVIQIDEPPCFWQIEADGDWTLIPREG
jgi:hypothetical protein